MGYIDYYDSKKYKKNKVDKFLKGRNISHTDILPPLYIDISKIDFALIKHEYVFSLIFQISKELIFHQMKYEALSGESARDPFVFCLQNLIST